MAITYSVTFQNLWTNSFADLLEGKSLHIRSSGALLGSATIPSGAFSNAVGGDASLANPFNITITAGGTASIFRIMDGGTQLLQGTITAAGGNGDMQMSSTTLSSGIVVVVNEFDLIFPG